MIDLSSLWEESGTGHRAKRLGRLGFTKLFGGPGTVSCSQMGSRRDRWVAFQCLLGLKVACWLDVLYQCSPLQPRRTEEGAIRSDRAEGLWKGRAECVQELTGRQGGQLFLDPENVGHGGEQDW